MSISLTFADFRASKKINKYINNIRYLLLDNVYKKGIEIDEIFDKKIFSSKTKCGGGNTSNNSNYDLLKVKDKEYPEDIDIHDSLILSYLDYKEFYIHKCNIATSDTYSNIEYVFLGINLYTLIGCCMLLNEKDKINSKIIILEEENKKLDDIYKVKIEDQNKLVYETLTKLKKNKDSFSESILSETDKKKLEDELTRIIDWFNNNSKVSVNLLEVNLISFLDILEVKFDFYSGVDKLNDRLNSINPSVIFNGEKNGENIAQLNNILEDYTSDSYSVNTMYSDLDKNKKNTQNNENNKLTFIESFSGNKIKISCSKLIEELKNKDINNIQNKNIEKITLSNSTKDQTIDISSSSLFSSDSISLETEGYETNI